MLGTGAGLSTSQHFSDAPTNTNKRERLYLIQHRNNGNKPRKNPAIALQAVIDLPKDSPCE
jgi:hypothetical protein